MTDTPVVSIIVPIYNSKKYLRECMDSVLKQTLKEIEVILVDDGSTDGSSELCDELARKDGRIKVIHQPNGGAAAARNAGIDRASGKWLGFVDSDDYIAIDTYEKAVKLACEHNADIVQWELDNEFRNEIIHLNPGEYVLGEQEVFDQSSLCNKLFRRDLIELYEIRLPLGRIIAEDQCFSFIAMAVATKIWNLPEKLYYYRANESSATHSLSEKAAYDQIKVVRTIENTLGRITLKKEKYERPLRWLKCYSKFLLWAIAPDDWNKTFPEIKLKEYVGFLNGMGIPVDVRLYFESCHLGWLFKGLAGLKHALKR